MSLKSSFRTMTRKAGEVMDSNGSQILIGIGIASFFAATVSAIVATVKAEAALDELDAEIEYECEHNDVEPPEKKEYAMRKVKKLAPIYAPTIISFGIGVACTIKAEQHNIAKIAAITSAFEVSQREKRDLTNYIRNHLGEKAGQEFKEKYAEKRSKEDMPKGPKDPAIHATGHGDQLFYDGGTGRYFRASVAWLEKCQNEISHIIFTDDYASANELAYLLGLDCTTYGNLLGWNSDDLDRSTKKIRMEWKHCSMSDWGEPYAILEYDVHERFKELSA